MASPSGLAAVTGAAAGDPIVIAWSGFESRASGIRSAMPDDGSGLWGGNRFLLQAAFVEMDGTGRYLTFETMLPKKSLATVRALKRGSWASVMSPHHPADGFPAVLAVDGYVASRERRPAPLAGASYRWDGELVSLDEATGMLTVRSRVASPSGLAAVAGAVAGDPIVINWSGYSEPRERHPERLFADDGSGLWGSNRFLLRADARRGRRREPLPDLRGLPCPRRQSGGGAGADARRVGEPAVGASPRRMRMPRCCRSMPMSPQRDRRPAPLPGATYRWDGELVSLDEATGTLTVKSRVVSPSGLAAVAGRESPASPSSSTGRATRAARAAFGPRCRMTGRACGAATASCLRATFVADGCRRVAT